MTHEAPSPESLLEHREWLRAIARSLVRDENDVDDVEQRTWLTVLRNGQPVTSVRGWLRRVVRSSAVDEYRSESRRHAREEGAARPEDLPPTDHLVMQVEAQRAVAQAVAGLPEPYRTTVLLRYIEELPVRDVAARMGVPVKTVETRLRRALALLREALDREFGDRRAWCVLLLPLTRTKAPIPIGAATAGALAMAAKTKVVAAAVAVVLLAGGVAWTVASGTDESARPVETATADGDSSARTAQATGPKFAVVGRVRSRRDSRPVEDAHVTFGRGTRVSADTLDDGTFRIEGVATGTLHVDAPRFRTATLDVKPRDAGDVVDVGDVWLDGFATLLVEVTGPGDAKVAGAEVTLVRRTPTGAIATTNSYLRVMADPDFGRTAVGSARSGPDGVARFEGIAPGTHEVAARAAGFASRDGTSVEVPPEREETTFTVRLSAAYRVAGRVVTAAGEPAADRVVEASPIASYARALARTDADGRFALDDVAAGDVEFRVGRTRGTSPVVAVVRVPDVSEIELRLPAMGSLSGTVTLADGSPVADAEVGVETQLGGNQTADVIVRTGADGRWRVDDFPAGSLGRFDVRHPGLYHVGPRLESGVLNDRRSGKDTGVVPRVSPGGELRLDATMAKGARLHGRVVGPDGGVAGAWVYLHLKPTKAGQEWETAVADADGRYEFDFLPPGPAAAVPLHPAYVHADTPKDLGSDLGAGKLPASLTFNLPEGGDVERDFTLAPATRVAGRVTGPSGAPVEGAEVRVDSGYHSPPTPIAVTDANGAFVMEAVTGIGDSKIRVDKQALAQENVPDVALRASGRVEGVEIRMVEGPRVLGHVLDADGAGVAGARVTIMILRALRAGAGGRPCYASTDASGAYAATVPWLDGKLFVSASRDGGAETRVEAELTAGGANVDVRFAAMSAVTGRVTAADGRPVAGASVLTLSAARGLFWNLGDLISGGESEVVRTTTDTDGRFRVVVEDGAWAVIARREGLLDEVASVTAPCATELKLAMQPAATLAGTLRGDDGRALGGAVVVLEPSADVPVPRTTMVDSGPGERLTSAEHRFLRHTDASGAFRFPGIPEGSYALVAVLPTATPRQPREVRFGPLRPSGGPYDLSLGAPVGGALAGRIVDAGGAAYRDAHFIVQLMEERGNDPLRWRMRHVNVPVAADGTFRVDNLTWLSYTLQVSVASDPAAAIDPPNTTVYRRSQRRAFHGVHPPQTDLALEMTELPHLRGRLVDDAAAPLRGWMVTAEPAGDQNLLSSMSFTRDDGTFDIPDVEDGDYRLTLRLDGQPRRRAVTSRPARGGADLGDVVATLESRIRGRVVDAKGTEVGGADVQYYPLPGGEMFTSKSAADGTFELTGLNPDARYAVGVAGANGQSAWGTGAAPTEGVKPGTTDLRLVRK